jgi:hypothetical protein
MDFGSFRARVVGLGFMLDFAACGPSVEDDVERLTSSQTFRGYDSDNDTP